MTHKLLFAAVCGLMMAANGASAQSGFRIEGHVPGMKDGMTIRLINLENDDFKGELLTRTTARNGRFTLTGSVASPTLCRVEIVDSVAATNGAVYERVTNTRLMVENVPMTMTVAHVDSLPQVYEYDHSPLEKEMNATVSGGQEQAAYNAYRSALHRAELRAWRLDRKSLDLRFAKPADRNADSIARYKQLLAEAEKEVARLTDEFIRSHPQTSVSAYLVGLKFAEPFKLTAEGIDSWLACIRNNSDTARLERVRRMAEAAKPYVAGQLFKDFVLTDPQKQTVSLSAARRPGVCTLVDFWASWCGPCRAAIPHLKELYQAQSGRLDILSVSVDRKEADWRKAMGEEQMPWRQYTVSPEVSKQLVDLYQLHSIPFLLLLDPDGRIVVGTHNPDEVDAALERAQQSE